MRILTLIHEYPPIGGGGGRVAQDVARGLVSLGHDVCVLAPHMRGLDRLILDEGVRLVRILSLRRKPFVGDLPAMFGYLAAGFFAALRTIHQFRPHVIHVHFAVPAGFLAWLISKLTGIPYVLTSHLGDVPGGVPEKTDRWFRWIYPFTPRIWRDASAVTAISDFTRHLALTHYPVDIRVIPNGIRLDPSPSPIRVNRPPQIVFAGRFVSQKNPEHIPHILNELRDLDWRCVMIGDGIMRQEILSQVATLGLADRFSLPGWRAPEDVEAVFRYSDILLLPSRTEGIPLTGLQALANGLAIVASRVGGMMGVVQDGQNGFLHTPENRQGFVASLRSLLTDPELLLNARMASRAHAQEFELSRIVGEYEKVLLQCAKQGTDL